MKPTTPPQSPDPAADRFGHRVHAWLAMLHLLAIPVSTAATSITFGALLVFACVRLGKTWPSTRHLAHNRVMQASAVWVIVQVIGFAWSAHPAQALDDLSASRMLLLPILLFPVLDQAPRLIVAFLVGVAITNVLQLGQGLEVLGLHPEQGRWPGLMHPIITGACCVAAMCWHLGLFADGRGWHRWLALGGLGLAAVGLIVCGSRGPWLAGAATIPSALIVLAVVSNGRRWILALTAVGVIGAAAAWPLLSPRVVPRVQQAVTEWTEADEDGVVWNSAGLRRALWRWSGEMFRAHPLIGVGPGDVEAETEALASFKAAAERATEATYRETIPEYDELIRTGVDPTTHRRAERAQRRSERVIAGMSRAHTHSIPLNTLARLGLLGGAALLMLIGTIAVQSVRSRVDHVLARATVFIFPGWILGGLFDCYEMNAHTMGLLGLVIALTLPTRPPVVGPRKGAETLE